MLKTTLLSLALALAAIASTGCVGPRAPIEPNAVPYGNAKQVYADSYRLKQVTNIDEPPRMSKDQFGFLHIVVPIRSVIDPMFNIQYRVTFFDANRNVVNIQEWSDKPLTPNTPDQIIANSPVPAEDFRVDLRLAPGYTDI